MKIIAESHCHSNHSHDGIDSLESICEEAIRKGLKVLCTSEHLFLDSRDVGYGYFDLETYLEEVKRCHTIFQGELEVLSGVEFSETHLHLDELEALKEAPIDMIVGALHWMEEGFFGEPEVLAKNNPKELIHDYYQRLYEMVIKGGFDTLAHMDLLKRYVAMDEKSVTDPMMKVLRSLVEQNIALEINTSTIRRDHLEPAASYALADAYLKLGGQRLTVGSDAHCLEDVGADFDKIPERYTPYIGYYRKREFVRSHS